MRSMSIEVLGERYQLGDPIGRGGMATIYRGQDMRMERVVAIKVLREVYSTDPKFVTRFQREAKAASSLQHPNIVQVYDYGQTDGNYFIVMELIEGTDLRRYLRSRGVLAVDRAIIIAHDVALGLGAAHRRGIVHRDVKPQNVLVGRDGSIKLTDFGIASVYKDINAERLTTTGMTLGTVQYYAPEQAQGEIVSPAADVYALGIVMYEMLAGRTPFDGDTPVAVAMQHIQDMPTPPSYFNPDIPPALEGVIMRCLEKEPERRYRDGSTLARALELLGESEVDEVLPGAVPPGLLQTPPGVSSFTNYPTANGTQRTSSSSPNNMMYPSGNGMARQPEPLILANQAGGYNNQLNEAPIYPQSTQPRAGSVPYDRRESRFAGIVTALILLAALLLLGFSIYLAAELNFIRLPWINGSNVTPTSFFQELPVPDLRGQTYQDALTIATNAGFRLMVTNNTQTGVVLTQSPLRPAFALKGSVIRVTFGQPTVVVPPNLVGNTLSGAEQILINAGITNYTVRPDGTNQNNSTPNIVSRVDPPSGSKITKGQSIILYVQNYTNGTPKATATPDPVPTSTPTPKPTNTPTPTPTNTPTPTPTPTKIPTPTPTPTKIPVP
jgi:eukaryotic-like serine/threonine-protein kinase